MERIDPLGGILSVPDSEIAEMFAQMKTIYENPSKRLAAAMNHVRLSSAAAVRMVDDSIEFAMAVKKGNYSQDDVENAFGKVKSVLVSNEWNYDGFSGLERTVAIYYANNKEIFDKLAEIDVILCRKEGEV